MKNKLFSLLLVSVFMVSPHFVLADSGNITKLAFTNDVLTVKPGEISTEIKVQTQNTTGTAEPVSETNDVTFSSSSPTGEFLNSTGNAVTKTMSKNTSSRTFFYRDSATGEYVLTIGIKGRDTGKSFTATQSIKITNTSSDNTNTTATTTGNGGTTATTTQTTSTATTTQTTTATSTNTVTNNTDLSAHSGTVSITYITPELDLKVDAGRHRISITKNPIEFDAKTSELSNYTSNAKYTWTFGDGRSDTGKKVTHTYLFPGEYNVVLNVDALDKHAVSRTVVKVINPEVEIIDIQKGMDGYVELRNNSTYEVNVGGWIIDAGSTKVEIARDTIITPNTSVKLPFDFSNDDTGLTKIVYNDKFVASAFGEEGVGNVAINTEPTIEDIEKAKKEVAAKFALEDTIGVPNVEANQVSNIGRTKDLGAESDSNNNTNILVSAESIIDSVQDKSPDTYLAAPKKFFNFIKNFFTK
jgi:PKD domain